MKKYTRKDINVKTQLHGETFFTTSDVTQIMLKLLEEAVKAGADEVKLMEFFKMKKIRAFKCAECEALIERMVEDHVMVINCNCKGLASRQLSSPKCFSNTTGKSPSAR